ncbi:MAG: BatA domain-containing protein [Planctomycetota bacterium]|nr:BatA domain-containing protein [Planctomycetota bacterium]
MELSFAAPVLLWLLPAAGLPVVLHFRARLRERSVDFPGAFFLDQPATPQADRRRRLEDRLLLALRCALLGAAILALAGPSLKGLALGAPDDAPETALAVAVDDSPSLAARRGEQGEQLLPRAWKRLLDACARRGVRLVAIETAAGRREPWRGPEDGAARNPAALQPPFAAAGDRAAALTRVLARFEEVEAAERAVVLLTDAGPQRAEGDGAALRARWEAALARFESPGAPPLFAWLAETAGAQWSVESLEPLHEEAPVAGQAFGIRVRVACQRGGGTRRLRVRFAPLAAPDGARPQPGPAALLLDRDVALEAGQAAELDAPVLAAQAGALWFEAALEGEDERPFDDRAERVVPVEARRRVVVWDLRDGEPRLGADPAREALAAGLDPLDASDADRVELLIAPRPRAEDLREAALLVALHGPEGPRLPPGLAERLHGAVEAGLQLAWLPDLSGAPSGWPRYDPARRPAVDPLLARGVEGPQAREDGAEKPWRLGLQRAEHPLLQPFGGGRNGDVGSLALRRRLRLAEGGGGDEETVLLRFDDGLPAWLVRPLGAGAVHQFGFGVVPNAEWTASPAWPVLWATLLEWAAADGLGPRPGPRVAPGASAEPWPLAPRARARSLALDGPWPLSAGGGRGGAAGALGPRGSRARGAARAAEALPPGPLPAARRSGPRAALAGLPHRAGGVRGRRVARRASGAPRSRRARARRRDGAGAGTDLRTARSAPPGPQPRAVALDPLRAGDGGGTGRTGLEEASGVRNET